MAFCDIARIALAVVFSLQAVAVGASDKHCGYSGQPKCSITADVVNLMGNAVVVNFTEVVAQGLPVNLTCAPQPHSTVLWTETGYTETARAALAAEIQTYKLKHNVTAFEFHLTRWDEESDYVIGAFADLWRHLKKVFKAIDHNERPCHVQLRCGSQPSEEVLV
eukprot:TRINITY_DN26042_c0_g1_i1.p1 TRINITY_DN26042_c0_g1~~TRINITY_DN26042_c0_g1_i1.p1  ORF type:complete len:164 (+),score=27.03 TRINITY_DN26042_c0_g1_i1:65-556(+)